MDHYFNDEELKKLTLDLSQKLLIPRLDSKKDVTYLMLSKVLTILLD
jgi:hypothetical protein